jgi:hypothetical protein
VGGLKDTKPCSTLTTGLMGKEGNALTCCSLKQVNDISNLTLYSYFLQDILRISLSPLYRNTASALLSRTGNRHRILLYDVMRVKLENYCPSKINEATTQRENTFLLLLTPSCRSLTPSRPPQKFRLSKAYGGRARDVLEINKKELGKSLREGKLIPGMPYLDAEVIYAARYEWAVKADDIIARRTRLAFLNKDAAIAAIPRCAPRRRRH